MGAIDRRLAAIMVADMEQYSRLMHEDELGTVLAWQKTREEVVKPTVAIAKHALNHELKNEMITSDTTSPMTDNNPIIIHSIIIK